MQKLNNKVAIVTGASRGIGKAIACLLADSGAQVVVNYASSQDAAEKTVQEITATGGEAIAVGADVSQQDQVCQLFDKAIERFGRVDVLINNAGYMYNQPLAEADTATFDKTFDVNVKGIFYTLQEAAIRLADNGSIINISSGTVKMTLPTYALYSASKAAVEQLTRVFAQEVGRGISVNAVAPGGTKTELFLKGKSEALIEQLKQNSPFNRLGEPIDTARVVAFMASDDAKWINGSIIPVNGGAV